MDGQTEVRKLLIVMPILISFQRNATSLSENWSIIQVAKETEISLNIN
jgi:hypothetical protein